MMIGAVRGGMIGCYVQRFRVEIVRRPMRYRCEYLHVPTSSRILFTVSLGPHEELPHNSAFDAMAKRAAMKWIEATELAAECVLLDVVRVTDKMSVWIPPPIKLTDLYSGQIEDRLVDCRRSPEHDGCAEQGHSFV